MEFTLHTHTHKKKKKKEDIFTMTRISNMYIKQLFKFNIFVLGTPQENKQTHTHLAELMI